MSRLVVAALVLLIGIGSLLGAAAWNRGGDPQFIELTERELELPWTWENGRADDDAELRLAFRWQLRAEPQDARVWLSDVKLRALGFGTGVPAGAPEAELVYGRSLPRVAWVAFEFDGPGVETHRAEAGDVQAPIGTSPTLAPPATSCPWTQVPIRSRCAAVMRAVPAVVMPAIVHMRYAMDPAQGPSVWGWVPQLVSNDVSVPYHLRERLRGLKRRVLRVNGADGAAPEARMEPRYDVKLGVGRLGAVWVEDVRVRD